MIHLALAACYGLAFCDSVDPQCAAWKLSSCLNALRKRCSSVEGNIENGSFIQTLYSSAVNQVQIIISLLATSLNELDFDWSIILCVPCPLVLIALAGQPGVCSAPLGPTSVAVSLSSGPKLQDAVNKVLLHVLFCGASLWRQSSLSGVRRLKKKDLGIIRGVQGRI